MLERHVLGCCLMEPWARLQTPVTQAAELRGDGRRGRGQAGALLAARRLTALTLDVRRCAAGNSPVGLLRCRDVGLTAARCRNRLHGRRKVLLSLTKATLPLVWRQASRGPAFVARAGVARWQAGGAGAAAHVHAGAAIQLNSKQANRAPAL